jgi:flavin reductase (DIM6/NTAB) family NADH-FMN oxidoreductase RutF
MAKVTWKPGTMLYPVPAAMISCKHGDIENIITISWVGTICSDPPMVSISVRPSRYSYDIIKNSGVFIINIPGKDLTYAADFCGVKSGRDLDKFAQLSLGKEKASIVDVPIIAEAPVAIECRVKDIIKLGSHDMFIADVVAVNVDEKYIDEMNRLNLDKAELICYNHGKYCIASNPLGKFGYSVEKAKTKEKRADTKKKTNAAAGRSQTPTSKRASEPEPKSTSTSTSASVVTKPKPKAKPKTQAKIKSKTKHK